jgi:O-antigen ligase
LLSIADTPVLKRITTIAHDSVRSIKTYGRLYVWTETLKLIRKKPVFGHGFNSLAVPNPDPASNDYYDRSHQDLLDMAHALGGVGLLCYLAIWGWAFAHASSLYTPSLVAYFLWCQFNWQHLGPANVFWAVAGLGS